MSSSHHYPLIPKLLFLLAGAFILGGQAGKLHSWQKSQAASASLLSESTSWGLSFQKEGERPVGNATINDLGKYHAYYAEDTNEKKSLPHFLMPDTKREHSTYPQCTEKCIRPPATFFVVGNFISDNPDLIRRMVSEGHTVGNHTMTHPDMSGISSKDDFHKQLDGVENLYESVTGEQMTKFYRPPQGIYSTSNLAMAKELGYSTFFWSLAYVDWIQDQQPSREEAFQKLLGRIHPGAIVLLHNTSSTNGLILDDLLTKWEEMGYRFCSLKELTGA